jgi:hypothetical protein
MANDLRVEKRPEQVSLFMADGYVLEATVFLAQYAMNHSGEQNVLDLLLEADPFLPAKADNGEFHLVRKGMIGHIRCEVHLEQDLEYVERTVKVSFPGGEILQGLVKMDMPAHSARLTDYINGGNEFFPLFSGEHAHLVNRNLVRDLVLVN